MISQAYANTLLDQLYGSGTPATLYFALFTSAPAADGTGGTEVTGGSYARVAVTNNATNFPAAASGQKSNGTAIVWPTATADWGIVTDLVVISTSSGAGTRYDWGALDTPKTILNGDAFSIAATQFVITD